MNTHKRLISIACLIGQPLLLNAISIPAMAYIIRRLGPLGYGQWMVATSLVALTSFIANLGLRSLFVRAIAQNPNGAEEALAEQMGLRMLLSLLAGFVAIMLCWCLGYPRVVCQCVFLSAIGLMFTMLYCALAEVLQGFQRFKVYSGVNLISGLVLTLASVAAMRYGLGLLGLSLSYLIGPVVSFGLFAHIVKRHLFPVRICWHWKRYRELLRDAQMMGAQHFLAIIQERIEQLLIPKLVGVSAFGYFSAGAMPANRLIVFPDSLATAYYPQIAQNHLKKEASLYLQVSRLLTLSLIICLPLAVLVTFLARPIAQLLFPRHEALCQQIIQITIWSLPLVGISVPMSYALQAVGKHAENARSNMWATCLNIVLSLMLISHFGIAGACWNWILRSLVVIVCLLPRFRSTFPCVLRQVPVARLFCSTLLMTAILLMATRLHISTLTVTGMVGLAALAIYSAALIIFRIISAHEIKTLFA